MDAQEAVIIALERTFFPAGISRRGGTREASLSNVKFATPWNHIEAGMAYSRGLPLLVIVENGIKSEGLLEPGYDWYVQSVKPELSALTTVQFNGVLAGWKKKVEKIQPGQQQKAKKPIADQTIVEIIASLKPAQLWSVLVALAALIAGAFTLGAKFLGPVK